MFRKVFYYIVFFRYRGAKYYKWDVVFARTGNQIEIFVIIWCKMNDEGDR